MGGYINQDSIYIKESGKRLGRIAVRLRFAAHYLPHHQHLWFTEASNYHCLMKDSALQNPDKP